MSPSALDNGVDGSGLLDGADSATSQLAMMKLRSSVLGSSELERPSSSHSHSGMLRAGSSSKALSRTKTSRHTSSASRRNSSFIAGHRSKMAAEMTMQAENKFFSLMDLMNAASKEASSLKEIWSSLMADREAFNREREEMLTQIEEYSEVIESKDNDTQGQHRELGERRKEVEKLIVQLSTAMGAITEQKQKVTERDHDLENVRREIATLQTSTMTLQSHHDKLKFDLDASRAIIIDRESERDTARLDADRSRQDFRTVSRENTELKSKIAELMSHLDISRKENASLIERTRSWERERADFLYEKDRLSEELRRMTGYRDEATRELHDAANRHDALQRELHKVRETIRHVELERDEHATTLERLRHENTHKTTRLTEIEGLHADVVLKLEQSKREVTDKLERISFLEIDLSTLRTQLETKHEEWRLIVLDRDSANDDLEAERRKVTDTSRQILALQEQISRGEMTVSELRSEILRVTEVLRAAERERDGARGRHGPLESEILSIKEKLTLALAEVESNAAARDSARKELDDYKYQYEEITETMSEWHNDSDELKFEIESLRTMIRDLREQKERAISARNAADRERDDCVARYEEKCRQMERMEESKASQLQQAWAASSSSKQGGGTRVTSKSTVMHHGHEESSENHEE